MSNNPVTRDFLHSKIKCGDVFSVNFKKALDPSFHLKYFV
ncbi:DUF1367 family protein [Proteus sp. G2666]